MTSPGLAVSGIDIGDATSCIAVADRRGVTVVLNKESVRETPSLVSFSATRRLVGCDAAPSLTTNPANTVGLLKRLLGKAAADPGVQADAATMPYKVVEAAGGAAAVQVTYQGEPRVFAPEQLLAALAADLAAASAQHVQEPVLDCVAAIPAYFTDGERCAALAGIAAAGIKVSALINDTTAAALAYAVFHAQELAAAARTLAIVDVGHTALQASIVSVGDGKLRVLSHAWDRNLGGRNFTELLFRHFGAEFLSKTRKDIFSNARAAFRLRVQCEKVKKVLSANKAAPLTVECLVDDVDFSSTIEREKFEELAAPLVARVTPVLQQACSSAGVAVGQVSVVELVGGGSRVPALIAVLRDFFGRQPSRTMHSKEVVAEGAAWRAAMLSGKFRVAPIAVHDVQPYALNASWATGAGQPHAAVLFAGGHPVPGEATLLCSGRPRGVVQISYDPRAALPLGCGQGVGSATLGPLRAGMHKAPVFKATFALSASGTLGLLGTQQVEGARLAAPDGVLAPAAAALVERGAACGGTLATAQRSDADMQRLCAEEAAQLAAVAAAEAAAEAFNTCEGRVLVLRRLLGEPPYSTVISAEEADKVAALLDAAESWLYEEGEHREKEAYAKQLETLQALQDALEFRVKGGVPAAADAASPMQAPGVSQPASAAAPAAASPSPAASASARAMSSQQPTAAVPAAAARSTAAPVSAVPSQQPAAAVPAAGARSPAAPVTAVPSQQPAAAVPAAAMSAGAAAATPPAPAPSAYGVVRSAPMPAPAGELNRSPPHAPAAAAPQHPATTPLQRQPSMVGVAMAERVAVLRSLLAQAAHLGAVSVSETAKIGARLDAAEAWLQGEGRAGSDYAYAAQMAHLQALQDAMEQRVKGVAALPGSTQGCTAPPAVISAADPSTAPMPTAPAFSAVPAAARPSTTIQSAAPAAGPPAAAPPAAAPPPAGTPAGCLASGVRTMTLDAAPSAAPAGTAANVPTAPLPDLWAAAAPISASSPSSDLQACQQPQAVGALSAPVAAPAAPGVLPPQAHGTPSFVPAAAPAKAAAAAAAKMPAAADVENPNSLPTTQPGHVRRPSALQQLRDELRAKQEELRKRSAGEADGGVPMTQQRGQPMSAARSGTGGTQGSGTPGASPRTIAAASLPQASAPASPSVVQPQGMGGIPPGYMPVLTPQGMALVPAAQLQAMMSAQAGGHAQAPMTFVQPGGIMGARYAPDMPQQAVNYGGMAPQPAAAAPPVGPMQLGAAHQYVGASTGTAPAPPGASALPDPWA